jgi:membrane-associated phospholipid phosphatase
MTAERLDTTVGGQHQFGPFVAAIDDAVDSAVDRVRGHPTLDRVFTTASHLGDMSLIWHLVGLARALTGRRRARQSLVLAALLGCESLLVNQGIKRLFRRPRPTLDGDPGLRVRRPLTSSFPSGHASSGAFAATVLTSYDGRRSAPVWWTLASIVGLSRVYVRIHHASDVIAGAVVGRLLGLGAARIARGVLTRWR